jgi:hypothetical protein
MSEAQEDLTGYATFIVFFPNSGGNVLGDRKRPSYELSCYTDLSIKIIGCLAVGGTPTIYLKITDPDL